LGFLLGLSVIFGVLFKITEVHWLYVAAFIPWIPLTLFAVVGIVFAFIINPIRRFKEKRRNK
jgi:membrane protein implicated in regulation of membrane protease activity